MATLLSIPGSFVAQAHTILGASAFACALCIGWAGGLWEALCENSVAKWPVEWFPSVSATIGDHALPRAPFHILIALCATPRFLLLGAQWMLHRNRPARRGSSTSTSDASFAQSTAISAGSVRTRANAKAAELVDGVVQPLEEAAREEERAGGSRTADIELMAGLGRTFCCGGWVYITSRDNHDLHDFFMIIYLILNLPWMFLAMQHSTDRACRRRRQMAFAGFLLTIPPLVWMFYRHSVLRIPGAYTHYSLLEWSLVFWDVAFDAIAITELKDIRITIVDVSASGSHPTSHDGMYIRTTDRRESSASLPVEDWALAFKEGHEASDRRALLAWLSDVYLAVCFWTVFTSLTFQLFYWSVWKLALAGSELALLANLSGYTMAWTSGRRFATSKGGLLTHRIIMVVAGMGCYFIPSVSVRLFCISLGTWTGWLAQFGNWYRLRGSLEMIAEGQTMLLGITITLLFKYVNASTNPLWATTDWNSGGWNITGLALAAAALFEYACRPVDLHPAPPTTHTKDKPNPVPVVSRTHTAMMAIGLGSFIHMIQTFVSDPGTIIAWTWTGFPVKGPTLHPYAGVVIAVACLGVLTSGQQNSPMAHLVGFGGIICLYVYPDWLGFLGGLALIYYLVSIAPDYIRAGSALPPAATFGNALLVNCILDVVSVVTAAYAFVPYGWLFRERTDIVLLFCMSTIALGSWASSSIKLPGNDRLYPRSVARMEGIDRRSKIAAVILSILALAAGYAHIPSKPPVPYYPEHRIFSGGIWAVHFGVDEPGRDSQRRMMELLRDMQVDVVGLLETDLHRAVYGNRDLTRIISEELGYYVDLGPGPNKHTWGAALLSKFPILNSTHHLLPSPHGELAPAIHATLDIHGEKVNVWVSHNGQEEDALDRELQTIEIARHLAETADVPTVFLGYLVTRPGDLRPWPYQILMEDGKMYDIEIDDSWRWCEYIAFRGLWRIGYARVHESDITDTELQVGKFMLPRPGEKVIYESNQEMYWHIGEDDVPEPWRMPRAFWDTGLRGHKYVVWKGPVYYMPPERSGLRSYGRGWKAELPERK
ncbi:Frag1/DRAM/Sfk1 family-domain-containing protein [Kockovaella imperatae]|uniref:Frag1/DRAM/Sfk1 family-domain-containing protein n=1 Tax=Kockovaella imperatae TaxID=4999 RepID=A0A1Y1UCW1_9TREE|nr:Frag1/DRAM/Sfk1 family-domain-containing protein [Kockovaella imperatae]ORX35356.1 Frag1/DRAM/Sfk1 family-domain-containing protein [Kockovaella imperatae]